MESSLPACGSPQLNVLVQRIRFAVSRRGSAGSDSLVADRVAAAIRPFLGDPDLLLPAQCEPDPECYRQHVLYVEDDGSFSVVALVWMPGQSTAIHDHVCWCVVGVHEGQELGIQYAPAEQDDSQFLLPVSVSTNVVGSVEALTPPGDIHRVVNPGPGVAISIHVYGADVRQLGSSIRRRYETGVPLPALPQTIAARAAAAS